MSNRHHSLSSSAAAASLSSPTKSPPVKTTPTESRRRRRDPQLSSTSSASKSPPTKSRRRRRRRRQRRRRSGSAESSSSVSSSASKSPKEKRGAKKVGSQKKLHALVLCEHERIEAKLLTSISTKKLIQYSRPIGQLAPVKKDPELKNFGCQVLAAIESFVRLLHSMEFTLEGNLSVSMLYWINSSKSVKLRMKSVPNLMEYTNEGARKDYHSIGTSIREDLFTGKGQRPPADVLFWIDLMAHPFRNNYLLRYSTALRNPRQKMNDFLSLYEKLLQASQTRYAAVLENIPIGATAWTKSVSKNKYVQKVYNKNKATRSNSVFELLRLVRDCIYHLMDYSVEGSVVKFYSVDKYLMIETCFPGVFHQFQKAMADEGFEDACLKDED